MQRWSSREGSTRDAALASRVAELFLLQQQAAGRGLAALLDAPASSQRSATVAFTSPTALAADVAGTQRLLRETTASPSDPEELQPEESDVQDVAIPTVHELPELLGDLYQALDGAQGQRLSTVEQTYADALMQVIVAGLTQLALAKPSQSTASQSQPMGQVRVWLLEMAVRPTSLSRRLAFTLFYNLSVTTTAILLVQSVDRAKEWQTRLFQVLVEMLSKAVVVASSSSPAPVENAAAVGRLVWMEHAVSCLLLFVKRNNQFRGDRLALLDPQILCFLLQETSSVSSDDGIDSNGLDQKLAGLLVLSMYSHQYYLQPKDEASQASSSDPTAFALSAAVVDRFGGIDFLLAIFYSTASWRLQTLLFMAFFDRAVDQTRSKSRTDQDRGEFEDLLRHLIRSELPQLLASTPLLFASNSFPSVIKKALGSLTSPSGGLSQQAQTVVGQLRSLMQVDEYFSKSTGLANTIKFISSQEKTVIHQIHTLPDTLMAKVAQLLSSSRLEMRFQGERWLAELLAFGTDDQEILPVLVPMERNSGSNEREGGDVRIATRAKLCQLAKSSAVGARQTFVHVVDLYLRRKQHAKISHSQRLDLMRELNACATVLLQQQEPSPAVLADVLLAIFTLSRSDVSAIDKQRLRYDRQQSDRMQTSSYANSLPTSILEGEIAIDQSLLQAIAPEFLLYALSVLQSSSHPPQKCRHRCCGVSRSLIGELTVCIAMLLPQILAEQDQLADGLQKLLPYLDACDTRLAIFVAKFMREQIKHGDINSYFDSLREMHAAAVDDDDEALLDNVYLHTRQLLLLHAQ